MVGRERCAWGQLYLSEVFESMEDYSTSFSLIEEAFKLNMKGIVVSADLIKHVENLLDLMYIKNEHRIDSLLRFEKDFIINIMLSGRFDAGSYDSQYGKCVTGMIGEINGRIYDDYVRGIALYDLMEGRLASATEVESPNDGLSAERRFGSEVEASNSGADLEVLRGCLCEAKANIFRKTVNLGVEDVNGREMAYLYYDKALTLLKERSVYRLKCQFNYCRFLIECENESISILEDLKNEYRSDADGSNNISEVLIKIEMYARRRCGDRLVPYDELCRDLNNTVPRIGVETEDLYELSIVP